MAIGAKHLEGLNRTRRGKRGSRRLRKNITNKKGILKIRFVDEDDKSDSGVDGKKFTSSIVGLIDVGVHFQIAFLPEGMKGDPPIFERIKEVLSGSDCPVSRVHNCFNLSNQKSTWLPPAMPVLIIKKEIFF